MHISRAGEIAGWGRALVAKLDDLVKFYPRNHHGGRAETLSSVVLTSIHNLWHAYMHRHTQKTLTTEHY